ncbi:MAG: hypothetical protein WCJ30_08995 [Deltaproteobacteria bacterium]
MSVVERNLAWADRMLARYTRSWEVIDFDVFARCFTAPADGVRGNVVSILNHGPPHSLLVVLPALVKKSVEYGLEHERPGVLFFDLVKYVPVLRDFAERITGGHLVSTTDEAAQNLARGDIGMYGTMPEGLHCCFEYEHPIGPFEKLGLVVAGIEARSKFVLVVHKGTEAWYRPLPLPLSPRVRSMLRRVVGQYAGAHALRWPSVKPGIDLRIRFLPYEPTITREGYRALDRAGRRKAIAHEAARMHAAMRAAWDEM